MKIGYNWLKEFIKLDISITDLAHKLTMAGIEVESIEYSEDKSDAVLELGITPNRSDCLSILGIAREVSALTGEKIIINEPKFVEDSSNINSKISIVNKNQNSCLRYCSRYISNIKIGQSPAWLQEKLKIADIKSINNVVDATNLVMMELGHPLHAFDYDKLEGKEIIIRNAKNKEKFTSLDKSDYELEEDMLVIADSKKTIAIAGVVGGANTEIAENTKNILLEAAYFEPICVRKTAKKLGIHTESSHRFERGVDYDCVSKAINRVATIITQIAGGSLAEGIMDIATTNPQKGQTIELRISRVNKILGTDISKKSIESYFRKLNFTITADNNETLSLTIPSYRNDISREADLIEEVARMYGYNNIPSTNLCCKPNLYPKNQMRSLEKRIKTLFSSRGYQEVINYSFIDDKFSSENTIKVKNPISKERSVMRTSLIPGLLQTIASNINVGNSDIKIFEIGTAFRLDSEEKMAVCAITETIPQDLWTEKNTKRTFFDIKGIMETIFNSLGLKNYRLSETTTRDIFFLNTYCSADIFINQTVIGTIGEVRNSILEKFDIKDKIYLFEININKLLNNLEKTKITFSSIPKYPAMQRDIALIVDKKIKSDNIFTIVNEKKSPLLQEVKIFDFYAGSPIPADKKSMAYSFLYRSNDRTLTDEEVDTIHHGIAERLQKELGATFR